jgi:hypothetical protein
MTALISTIAKRHSHIVVGRAPSLELGRFPFSCSEAVRRAAKFYFPEISFNHYHDFSLEFYTGHPSFDGSAYLNDNEFCVDFRIERMSRSSINLKNATESTFFIKNEDVKYNLDIYVSVHDLDVELTFSTKSKPLTKDIKSTKDLVTEFFSDNLVKQAIHYRLIEALESLNDN